MVLQDKISVLEKIKSKSIDYADICEDLLNEKDFVIEAIKFTEGNIFEYLPSKMQNDIDIWKEVLQYRCDPIEFIASSELWKNKEFVIKLVDAADYFATDYIHEDLLSDKELMIFILKRLEGEGWDTELFRYFRNDKEVVSIAISCEEAGSFERRALEYASKELQKDPELILQSLALYVDDSILSLIPDDYWENNEFITAGLKSNVLLIEYLGKKRRLECSK